MNQKMFKAMQVKKKREVNPNAPPRPNLLTHDVKIRSQQDTIEQLNRTVGELKEHVRRLENKLNNQAIYLQAVHQKLKNQ